MVLAAERDWERVEVVVWAESCREGGRLASEIRYG